MPGREVATKYNIKYFYDITDRSNFKANPDYKGVCHVALAQEGHCKPGEVLFGTDSHTCNAGAFGQFATGVGNTDAGFILGTGKLLIKVWGAIAPSLGGEIGTYTHNLTYIHTYANTLTHTPTPTLDSV
jgi:3-isopropylmalate/(R)-2-methylmalate dehydratase large subunit